MLMNAPSKGEKFFAVGKLKVFVIGEVKFEFKEGSEP